MAADVDIIIHNETATKSVVVQKETICTQSGFFFFFLDYRLKLLHSPHSFLKQNQDSSE